MPYNLKTRAPINNEPLMTKNALIEIRRASERRVATEARLVKLRKTSAEPGGLTTGKSAATKASTPREAAGIPEPSDEAVRLRAYFISERRRRFALPERG